MIKAKVDRSALDLVDAQGVAGGTWARAILATHKLPDGFPVLLDDDGTMTGTKRLNQYLLAAFRDGAISASSIAKHHVYFLKRFVTFLRLRRAEVEAVLVGLDVDEWLVRFGEPATCITETTRQDLFAYKEHRLAGVSPGSFETEWGTISSVLFYAVDQGWMVEDPRPRWGAKGRDTMRSGRKERQSVKFLDEAQLRDFLQLGLRCTDSTSTPSGTHDRDYVFGLLLSSTGLRRAEGAKTLNVDLPHPAEFPPGGVTEFTVVGKGERPRRVYVTRELAQEAEFYRLGERAQVVETKQPALRRARRDGRVEVVEVRDRGFAREIRRSGAGWVREELISHEDRARMVRRTEDGALDPICLFLGKTTARPFINHWDAVFAGAHERLQSAGRGNVPPAHLKVTPHVMRHTFAVRMLAALMAEGIARHANPYQLLANPVLTLQQLLGHVSPDTTQVYLYAAERFAEELPAALRGQVLSALGSGDISEGGEGK